MIGPNASAACIAHNDNRRIIARENEYLARYEADDLSAAMSRALAAFPHTSPDEMTERGYSALVRLVTS